MSAPEYALVAAGTRSSSILDVVHGAIRATGGRIVDERLVELSDHSYAFRAAWDCPGRDPAEVRTLVDTLGTHNGINWRFAATATPLVALMLVGPEPHVAEHLLDKQRADLLPVKIVAVGSNHTTAQDAAATAKVPFELVSTGDGSDEVEQQLRRLVKAHEVDVLLMARWMRVLSPELCTWLADQDVCVINVHHSALPSFSGARAYHQAAAYGARFVGATAHYVTAQGELDAGPILAQRVQEHRLVDPTAAGLSELGEKLEREAMTAGVALHGQARVVFTPSGRLAVFE